MAIRTDEDAVKGIIEVDDSIDLTPFIEVANNVVDQVCLASSYSNATLELIERWLAAHFYATRDPRTNQESVKGIIEQFEGTTKVGLNNTRYGQQALLIDTAGNLAALDDVASSGGGGGNVLTKNHVQLISVGGSLDRGN
jgi:hypothetical protein